MNMVIDPMSFLICGIIDVDIDHQIKLGHLLLNTRKCKTCGEVKNLINDFYRTRKNRGPVASSFSYECKVCTIRRLVDNRKNKSPFVDWSYPDW